MLGLQGKSFSRLAKTTQRASPSKPGGNTSNRKSTTGMSSTGSDSRTSSMSSEKPEKLSRSSSSPYNSKMSAGLVANTNRRVQSASTGRQRSSLGPTVKASELFRKKSETEPKRGTNPQRLSKDDSSTVAISKNVKHVRIDTDTIDYPPPSLKSRLSTPPQLFREQRGGSADHSTHNQRRRPFSFSSDRSISATSITSNDSAATYEHEMLLLPTEMGMASGDNDGALQWRHNFQHNLNNNNGNSNAGLRNSGDFQVRAGHPRLSKRTYSIDSTLSLDPNNYDDYENRFQQQDYRTQMIEMKISEQPEESLKEENGNSSRRESILIPPNDSSTPSKRLSLNSTFSLEDETMMESSPMEKGSASKQAQFDRLLLQQSDTILQGVSELIDEIKSSEMSKLSNKTSLDRTDSVEKLVDELKSDLNNKLKKSSSMLPSSGMTDHEGTPEKRKFGRRKMIDERFNFNCLDLSGIELEDITCPQQVMDQSVPNSSRLDRPLSAVEVFMGNNNNAYSVTEEADKYRLINVAKPTPIPITDGFESSDSNNQTLSMSDALSAIQLNSNNNTVTDGGASSVSTQSDFEVDPEEIQQKICSALKLLEEEDRKVRRQRRSSSSLPPTVSARSSLSPGYFASNSDSRGESRTEDKKGSSKSTPRVRSEERNPSFNELNPQDRKANDGYAFKDDGRNFRTEDEFPSGSRSARSCSCLLDTRSVESLNSARSVKTTVGFESASSYQPPSFSRAASDLSRNKQSIVNPNSLDGGDGKWETKDDKTKQIFSFLDEVEKTDQEILFGLRFEMDGLGRPKPPATASISRGGFMGSNVETSSGISSAYTNSSSSAVRAKSSNNENQSRTMDSLIHKGSVELSREILLLERKLDEAHHAVKLLEESLLNQRELNIRNLRNSERDFKKRMKLQKEEFDLTFSRNEALINEMASEKRILQEKLDKLIKNFEEMEEKHKELVKSMQQKHLDEIRRLRKMQQSSENSLKQKLAGNKTQAQEIREMTVKGLEPEVQRIIQRHQQEMSEMRAWHADELRETEERCQRKLHMQLEDMREKFAKEKEDTIMRERELANRRLDAELKQKDEEVENTKRRLTNEIFEERERAVSEELKLKEALQGSVRKAQVKGEVELENLKKEYETKLANLERRHESELKSYKDINEAEKQNSVMNQTKKLEHALSEQESKLRDIFQSEKEKEWKDKERKLKEEFEKSRRDDEASSDSRFRRLQEKFQSELNEMERTEKDIKSKFTQAKSDLLSREEELYSLRTSLSMKDKHLADLQEMSMKMQEERANLTSVIRREFSDQIQAVEEECRSLKTSLVEIQSNSKLQVEQKQLEIEKVIGEKDAEIEMIGHRVKQALGRKDETILELQKQLEKCSFQITHLEELLEEQRKEFLHSMKLQTTSSGGGPRKK